MLRIVIYYNNGVISLLPAPKGFESKMLKFPDFVRGYRVDQGRSVTIKYIKYQQYKKLVYYREIEY